MSSSIEYAMTDIENTLSDADRETLLVVVGHMIPASAEYGVPGADDPQIFADIMSAIERDLAPLRAALNAINRLAGGRLVDQPAAAQLARLADFQAKHSELAGVVEAATVRCYYRDARVMMSIGMEVRPPFPMGYNLEQGDFALLDPVRARGKIYRKTDQYREAGNERD